jgi:hypothetical protein
VILMDRKRGNGGIIGKHRRGSIALMEVAIRDESLLDGAFCL